MTGFSKEAQIGPKKAKNPGKLKQQSDRMAQLRAEYSRVLEEIDQERHPFCENCGANSFEHSHLVPRNFNDYAYMNVKANIRRNCRECHRNWEQGHVHLFPKIGNIYLDIVESLSPQYHRQKVAQFLKRLEEYREKNWLALSNGQLMLPGWVEEITK